MNPKIPKKIYILRKINQTNMNNRDHKQIKIIKKVNCQ